MSSNAMKLFLWRDLLMVSYRFHPAGGLVVIARDLGHARDVIAEYNADHQDRWEERPAIVLTDAEWQKVQEFPLAVEFQVRPQVIVLKDAGCC